MGDVQEVQKLESWQARVKASVAAGQSARSVPPARIRQDLRVAPYGPVGLPFGQSPVCWEPHWQTSADCNTLQNGQSPLDPFARCCQSSPPSFPSSRRDLRRRGEVVSARCTVPEAGAFGRRCQMRTCERRHGPASAIIQPDASVTHSPCAHQNGVFFFGRERALPGLASAPVRFQCLLQPSHAVKYILTRPSVNVRARALVLSSRAMHFLKPETTPSRPTEPHRTVDGWGRSSKTLSCNAAQCLATSPKHHNGGAETPREGTSPALCLHVTLFALSVV